MKWEHTEQLIASTTKLVALYARYCHKESLNGSPMARYTKVSQKDLDSMRSNVEKMNVESAMKELEGSMCFDVNQN